MVEKIYKLPELWIKNIESKLSYNDKKVKELRKFLEFNKENVKSLQTNLNKLLEKKWYAPITDDWKAGWQTFEAIRIFENKYRWKTIKDVNNLKNTDISDAMSWTTIELRKLNKEKDQKQQKEFDKVNKKAPQHEVKKVQKELDQVAQDKHKETKKVVEATKKTLKKHEKTVLDNQLLETISVKNGKGDLVPVKFAKWFKDKFDIVSKKNDLEFRSKDDLIPFDFDVNVDANPKEDNQWNDITDILGNTEYTYDFNLNIHKIKWVNTYIKENEWKNVNQVYYSFKKDGKVYLWVVWFKFDSDNWSITDFRTTEKELKNISSPFTKDELSNYESNVYDAWILDFSWYTVKEWTVLNNVNHMDIWTDEDTYDKLNEKYTNEIALKWALQFIWSEIATNSNLRNNFPIWWVDKEWVNTWDILWAVITLDWLKKSWLDKKLETLYKIIDKWTLTNTELKQVSKDISKYHNLDKMAYKEKIQWLADQNDSWKIWDMTDTIIWEKTIFDLMNQLPEEQTNQKINEISTLSGCPEDLKNTYFAKPYFYRWLERLKLSPVWLKKYLSWKIDLAGVEKSKLELEEKSKHDMLVSFVWEEKTKELEGKIDKKYNELKKELQKRLPDEHKNDPSIYERLRKSIEYTGITAAYIDHTRKHDDFWWAVNFSTDWWIIDNISLWVVSKDWHIIPWLAVSKSFIKKFNDNRSSAGIGWMLVDWVIPLLSLSASHDFNTAWLEKWDSSSRKIVSSIWTAFPILFGTLGYNFGKAGQIDYKEAKLDGVLNKMFDKLNKWEKLEEKDYSDKYEKELVRSLNSITKISKLDQLTVIQRKEVYKTVESWIKQNFSRLLWEEDRWTRLSEIGLIWAVIPLVYAKMESIKVNYSLDKKASNQLLDSFDDIKKHWRLESIQNINQLKTILEKTLGENTVEIKEGKLFINLNNVKNWTLIAFADEIQTKKVWNRLEIGWILTWEVLSSIIDVPWKHMNVLWIWQWDLSKWYWEDLSEHLHMKNYLTKDKNWKIIDGLINSTDKMPKLVISQWNDNLVDKKYIDTKKNFENSELSRLLDNSVDGGVFLSIYKKNFSKQYEELIKKVKNYKYNDVVNYISNTILAKNSWLSLYIYHDGWGQKVLDKIRDEIKQIQTSWDIILKQVFVEKFVNNLFLDEHIKIKSHYNEIKSNIEKWCKKLWIKIDNKERRYELPDNMMKKLKLWKYIPFGWELWFADYLKWYWEIELSKEFHKWYTARMSMKEFDTIDLAADTAYNRTAWFLRSVRNELLGGQNTLNGHLKLQWLEWVKNTEKALKQVLSENKPEWFKKLSKEKQYKIIALVHIALAWENYISKKWFEKPTYKTVSVSDIIAFPFTYKKIVKNWHGHVPMYGTADLVDVNGDGKFDNNDYTKIESEQVNEYMYSMLSPKFKNSLKETIKNVRLVELTNEQLKKLFVKKNLTIDWKTINLSYNTIYTKWWECFNSTLALTSLQLDGAGFWVSSVSGNVYLTNQADTKVTTSMVGMWRKVDPKEYSEDKTKEEDTPEDTPSNSNSWWWNKQWGEDDSVSWF